MSKLGWALGVLICLVVPNVALAQAVTVKIASIARERPSTAFLTNTSISLADCLAEDALKVTLNLGPGYENYALEAWAGDACDVKTNRISALATCWRVFSAQPNNSVYSLDVGVRELLSGRTGGEGEGNVPPACVATSGATAPQPLVTYFMLVDGGSNLVASASAQLRYKLQPSAGPDFLSASAAGDQLQLDFAFSSEPDGYVAGYRFFCEVTENCAASTRLVAGATASELDDLACGTAERDALSGETTGLEPNTAYNVAIAALDSYGNVSPLSPTACQTTSMAAPPEADQSASACSFSPRRAPSALLLALGLTAFGLVARRRSRYSRPAKIAASERSATQVTPSEAP